MEMNVDTVIQDIRARLETGAKNRKSRMHTAVVGTADCDLRVMVLREFDTATNTLRFNTDVRSPKVAVIRENSALSVLSYDPDSKVQIRMRGHGRVVTSGPAVDAAWDQATNFAKRCYLATAAPSSISPVQTSGLPEWAEGIDPTDVQVAVARQNFALIVVTVTEFDWLYLANSGHRRAKVTHAANMSDWDVQWLVP